MNAMRKSPLLGGGEASRRGRPGGMVRKGKRWVFPDQPRLEKYGSIKMTVYLDKASRERCEKLVNRLYPNGMMTPNMSDVLRVILAMAEKSPEFPGHEVD